MSEKWMRSTIRHIKEYYNPQYTDVIRMDTSTNVLGPNPVTKQVLRECMEMDLNQYPKPYSDDLRRALASFYDLREDMIIVGNGSDEVLDIIFKSLLNWGERVITPYPTYSLHRFFVEINGGKVETVDLTPDFQLRVDEMLETEGKIMLLCTPNNPTGNVFRRADVERIISEWSGPVVIDEAYGEFSGQSFIPLVNEYDNLIITRTFSKAYGLAGMRIGYLIASKRMTSILNRCKIPYSLNRVSERVAIAALENREYVERVVRITEEQRPRLASGLQALGFKVFPSQANFMLARAPLPSSQLVERLSRKGILIRDFGGMRMLENCVRTTVGTEELNRLLLSKLKEVLETWT